MSLSCIGNFVDGEYKNSLLASTTDHSDEHVGTYRLYCRETGQFFLTSFGSHNQATVSPIARPTAIFSSSGFRTLNPGLRNL